MQALERILAIVESVSKSPSGQLPARVAEETGLSLSTVVRIMQSLHDDEVLLRSTTTGLFRVGPRLIAVVGRATGSFGVQAAASAILEQLRDTSGGETASLHVRNGNQRMCVAAAYTTHPTGRIVPIGLALPLSGSAVGHVLLSQMQPAAFERLVRSLKLPAKGEAILRTRVGQVRRNGHGESADDSVEGVRGVAVPIGTIDEWGAVAISGPSNRFVAKKVPLVLKRLKHAAELIERSGLRPSALYLD